jgi:hypothetical protein
METEMAIGLGERALRWETMVWASVVLPDPGMPEMPIRRREEGEVERYFSERDYQSRMLEEKGGATYSTSCL